MKISLKSFAFFFFIVLLLALGLLLRIQIFRDFPFYNMADYNRDYMVAHYIVADG